MGIIEEAVFGDFRFVPEEEEVLPLKAYALASALILFSYSESIGVLTEETVGCVAVSFFCAIVNGLAREVFALFSYRRIQYKSYRKSFSTKSKYSFANGEEKLRKGSRDSLFSSITQSPTTEDLDTLPNVSWIPYREQRQQQRDSCCNQILSSVAPTEIEGAKIRSSF